MQPRIKIGLIVGAIGLVLNICAAAAVGLCGPVVMMVAGGVAGFFAAQQEKLPVKADGAKAGAIAGGITGSLMIIGQLIGGIGILAYMQATGSPTLFGAVPQTTDTGGTIGYYIGGFGSGFCLGLIGAALAAGVGAGAGYMATSDQPASTQM